MTSLDYTVVDFYDLKHEASSITTTGFTLTIKHKGNTVIKSITVTWFAVADDEYEIGSYRLTNDATLINVASVNQIKTYSISFSKYKPFNTNVILSVVGFTTSSTTKIINFTTQLVSI